MESAIWVCAEDVCCSPSRSVYRWLVCSQRLLARPLTLLFAVCPQHCVPAPHGHTAQGLLSHPWLHAIVCLATQPYLTDPQPWREGRVDTVKGWVNELKSRAAIETGL